MKTMRALLISAGALFAVALMSGQSVTYVPVLKIQEFDQTDASTVTEQVSNPWVFESFIDGTALTSSFPSGTATLTKPGGSAVGYTFDSGDNGWEHDGNTGFASQSAMDTAFANGTYNLTIGGINFSLLLDGNLYPNTPQATAGAGTWSGGKLILSLSEAAAGFSISSNTFTGWANDGTFRIGIDGSGNSYEQEAETFTANSLTMNVAADALTAGNTYQFNLEFIRIVDSDTSMQPTLGASALGIAGYGLITSFEVQVIPEPSTYAAILGALALAGVAIHRRRRAV